MRLPASRCWQSALTLACIAVPVRVRADVTLPTSWTTAMVFQCVDLAGICSTTAPTGLPAGNTLTLTNGGGSISFQFLGQSGALFANNAFVQQIPLGTLVSTVSGPFSGFPDVGNFPLFRVDLNVIDMATERGGTVFHGGVYLANDGTGNAYLSFVQPIWAVGIGGMGAVVTYMQYPPNDVITPSNNRVGLVGYEVIHFMPEPSTISLTFSGLALVGGFAVRRRQKA